MNFDLRDKLTPIGRLDIMKEVQSRINQFFNSLGEDISQNTLRQKATALSQYAETLKSQGQLVQSEKNHLQAHRITKKLAEDDPSNAN
jgi:hypothetical protein